MIQLQDNIAWVKFADGRLVPFDEHRLALSTPIIDALLKCGDVLKRGTET